MFRDRFAKDLSDLAEVHWVGHLSDTDESREAMRNLYGSSDVFVLPTRGEVRIPRVDDFLAALVMPVRDGSGDCAGPCECGRGCVLGYACARVYDWTVCLYSWIGAASRCARGQLVSRYHVASLPSLVDQCWVEWRPGDTDTVSQDGVPTGMLT